MAWNAGNLLALAPSRRRFWGIDCGQLKARDNLRETVTQHHPTRAREGLGFTWLCHTRGSPQHPGSMKLSRQPELLSWSTNLSSIGNVKAKRPVHLEQKGNFPQV